MRSYKLLPGDIITWGLDSESARLGVVVSAEICANIINYYIFYKSKDSLTYETLREPQVDMLFQNSYITIHHRRWLGPTDDNRLFCSTVCPFPGKYWNCIECPWSWNIDLSFRSGSIPFPDDIVIDSETKKKYEVKEINILSTSWSQKVVDSPNFFDNLIDPSKEIERYVVTAARVYKEKSGYSLYNRRGYLEPVDLEKKTLCNDCIFTKCPFSGGYCLLNTKD